MDANSICTVCDIVLNSENWSPSNQKRNQHICKKCAVERTRLWRKNNPETPEKRRAQDEQHRLWREANPDKVKVSWTKSNRKLGRRPFTENRDCSSFLGVHVAERVLSRVFKDVKRMPMHNPGYDFICNRGKRIDVKSACLVKRKYWMFSIKRNAVPDYFLCIAFDNREDLNPVHIWLIPGNEINHLMGTTICPSTIHKWDQYRLDISKVVSCCDTMKRL